MRLCAARDGERPGDGKSLRPCQDSSCHSPPLAVWRKPSEERYAEQRPNRSEEHTSELQSLMRISYAVFCLKKKKQNRRQQTPHLHIPKPCNHLEGRTTQPTP